MIDHTVKIKVIVTHKEKIKFFTVLLDLEHFRGNCDKKFDIRNDGSRKWRGGNE